MNTSSAVVVGLGEALWDVLPEGKQMGGAPANFAYHVAQFGWDSCAVSALGCDALGDELMQCFEERGLNCLMPRVDAPTGTVQVSLDEKGVPQYKIMDEVAWDYIPFTPALETLAKDARVACFGSLAQRHELSHTSLMRFLDLMPDGEGRYKIFDINLRQHYYDQSMIEASLRRCNILKMNDEELLVLAGFFGYSHLSLEEQCRQLREDFHIQIVILTCGAECSYVFTADVSSCLKSPQVQVADTVGAGDSFTASFIAGILGDLSIAEAHRLAVNVSAYVCTQHGAMPTLPFSKASISHQK